MEKQMESKLEEEGWCLQAQVVHQALEQLVQSGGKEDRRSLEGALKMRILDSDIRRIGARSLPDSQTFLHTRVLQGLRVLQILSVNDISQSSKRAIAGNNQQSRLLRFRLTDGHATVTAIELCPIPSVSQDLPPGTKVVLGNSVPLHTGVLLLDVNCIRVLGGHVQAMYDAWEIGRKYSGVAREAASKLSLPEGVTGPPPFRALQLERESRRGNVPVLQTAKQQDLNGRTVTLDSKVQPAKGSMRAGEVGLTQVKTEDVPSKPKPAIRPGAEPYRPRVGGAVKDSSSSGRSTSVEGTPSPPSAETGGARPEPGHLQRTEETSDEQSIPAGQPPGLQPGVSTDPPSTSSLATKTDERSKNIDQKIKDVISLGIENTHLQNRKAAQKLLEKSVVDTDWRRGGRRGGRGGREREDDASLMTLDEWEARKSSGNSSIREANTNRPGGGHVTDEELAWRLQQQLDLESSQGGPSKEFDPAEQLRASMFNFIPPAGDEDSRGRDRGRGRGRGSGRGRRHG